LREIGLHPTKIFDTELGARLAGLPRVGLGAVVEELLGVHLAKEHSAADWSTRPLPQSWLVYAALDVELLVDLRAAMSELLKSAGKLAFAEQEFAAIVVRDFVIVRAEPWRRLSGLNTVRGARNLAVARELWHARDDYAREIDTAPGRLVPDLSLCAAARALPQTQGELAALKEFSGRASRSQLNRWWLAIQEGLATTDLPNPRAQGSGDSVPPPRVWAEKAPAADRRLKGARAALLVVSETINIPVENLLLPETLRRICWNPPEPLSLELLRTALDASDARSWQIETVLQPIMDAFVEAAQEPEPPQDTSS
jgi:ribonuclease D